ncbi:type I restriction endonuclease subunit S [Rodentibacter trehalosifermentans]|uniref:Type I restriction endonuclease subunit S n=1 Tax=Rodentibacter trehalosifermentans TaxID=1908263 RepID=A0A1V3IZZ0_9PAST|nr:type I restriction endonuclease subunit S [Rodentibacter trehalosifermentans]
MGELGKVQSGIGFPETEQGNQIGIPFYKVSDMNLSDNEQVMLISNNYVSDQQISKNKWKVITDVPAIIFAKVGAALLLDRKRLVIKDFFIDNNMMAYSLDSTQWDTYFAKTIFENIKLAKYAQIGALPSFNASDITNISLFITNQPEQQKIGTFFTALDRYITIHQHK